MKIFQIVLTAISSYIVFLIILRQTGDNDRATAGFISILLSPILLWVNLIQLEQSTVGMTFALVAIYVLTSRNKDKYVPFIWLLVGSLFLWYSAFLYLIPIVLIPPILIYQRSLRQFLRIGLALFTGFAIFYIPFTHYKLFDIISGTAAIATKGAAESVGFTIAGLLGPDVYPPDHFQLIVKNVFTLLFVIAIVLIPISLRLLKIKNIFAPLLLNIISLFILVTISNLDEFSWILPFLILFLATVLSKKRLLAKLLLFQLYDLSYVLLFALDGSIYPVSGSGFFYLSYFQFHLDIYFYSAEWYSLATLLDKLFILSGFVSLVLSFIFVIYKVREDQRMTSSQDFSNNTHLHRSWRLIRNNAKIGNRGKASYSFHSYVSVNRKGRVRDLLITIAIITIFVLSITSPIKTNGTISSENSGFPFGFFSSGVIEGYNTTYAFIDNYKSIDIFPTSQSYNYPPIQPLIFSRNISGENLSMRMNFKTSSNINYLYNETILELGSVSINMLDQVNLNPNLTVVKPSIEQEIKKYNYNNNSFEGLVPILNFTGDNALDYNLNISNFSHNNYTFLFHADYNSNVSQNQIMYAKIGRAQLQFFTLCNSSNYFLDYANGPNWTTLRTYGLSSYWNFFQIGISNDSLWVNIDNLGQTFIPILNSSEQYINFTIGKSFLYPAYNYVDALEGYSSPLFVENQSISASKPMLLLSKKTGDGDIDTFSKNCSVILSASNENFAITSGNITMYGQNPNQIINFGRLSSFNTPVEVSITHLHITSNTKGVFLPVIFLDTFLLPLICTIYLATCRRQDRQVKQG